MVKCCILTSSLGNISCECFNAISANVLSSLKNLVSVGVVGNPSRLDMPVSWGLFKSLIWLVKSIWLALLPISVSDVNLLDVDSWIVSAVCCLFKFLLIKLSWSSITLTSEYISLTATCISGGVSNSIVTGLSTNSTVISSLFTSSNTTSILSTSDNPTSIPITQ